MRINPGTVLETKEASYTVVCAAGSGGFGSVWRVARDGDGVVFAAKFMQEPQTKGLTRKAADELWQKSRARFKHEIACLQDLDDIALAQEWAVSEGYFARSPQPYPEYVDAGEHDGIPFYVMEWLEPVNLYSLDTDEKRVRFVSELCDAVSTIHGEGDVHYDIKPANIMQRLLPAGSTGYKYVLTDFGSIHKAEEHPATAEQRKNSPVSVSVLHDGRRVFPHTPGYADPMDDLHTIHGDIYAFGQVIRDLFADDVPFEWNYIINRCISRNYKYRYNAVADLKADICSLDRIKREVYNRLRREHIKKKMEIEVQSESYETVEVSWTEILKNPRITHRSGADLTIDLDDDPECFRGRHVHIKGRIRLKRQEVLRFVGPGILDADISGAEGSLVVLRQDIVLHDRTTVAQPRNRVTFVLSANTYLNFSRLRPEEFTEVHAGQRRIFRSPTAVTTVGYANEKTLAGIRAKNIDDVRKSQISAAYKNVLLDYYAGENLLVRAKR